MSDDTPSYPPLAEQAGHLAGAVVRFVASGLEVTTAEERARRSSICVGCEEFVPPGRCRHCGCRLGFKIRIASEHCPLDPPKW